MKRFQRWQIITAITIVVLILITIFAAPSNNTLSQGSVYNNAPDGYGAWYKYMQERGNKIEIWQKPFADLAFSHPTKVTLLRINSVPTSTSLSGKESTWIEKGNTLVILGVEARATQADFNSKLRSSVGDIQIDTTRRAIHVENKQVVLSDRFGAVVWQQSNLQEKSRSGKLIFATTQYLAANAYQDSPNNYEFLAELVSQDNQVILIDEYAHGYRDADVIAAESKGDLLSYFQQTPIFLSLLEGLVVLAVAIWGFNHCFGQPIKLESPALDNSTAYMQALAAVLHKAECSDFVIDTLGKAEQLHLQKVLGLGTTLLESEALLTAWQLQTNRSTVDLKQVLRAPSSKGKVNESQLLTWLATWQRVRSQVDKHS